MDTGKKKADAAGRNAREFLRQVWDACRDENGRWLTTAVDLPGGATLRVAENGVDKAALDHAGLDLDKGDHRIIGAALGLAIEAGQEVVIVSGDAGLRIKAAVLGQHAIEHQPVTPTEIARTGIHTLDVPGLSRHGGPLTTRSARTCSAIPRARSVRTSSSSCKEPR